jgi:predicted CXXCH cytochrome family protein
LDSGTRKGKTSHPFLLFFLLFVSLWVFSGCDQYARYRVLHFFFDGVPHPDQPLQEEKPAPVKIAMTERGEGEPRKKEPTSSPTRYRHPPVEGRDDCSFCHGPLNRIALPPGDICLKCHTDNSKKFSFIHPPAISECTGCHDPHESQAKALLKKMGNSLCFDCHDQKEVQEKEPHREMKKDELICLSCHHPHGGGDRSFLK